MSKRILLVGEAPFVDVLLDLCEVKGFKVDMHYVEDLDEPENLDKMVKDAGKCDLFIESLNDSKTSKLWLIEGVEPNLKEKTTILTNCLCASATEVASWCENPSRVVGFGLLPPITFPGLVEYVPSMQANFHSAAFAREFFEKIGLEPVRVPDTPGMVRARMVCALINEAALALDRGVASAEDIDTGTRLVLGLPRGPLAWADEIGLDVVLGTLLSLHEYWGEARFHPAPLLRQKVRAGHLGKKTGRGFFIDTALDLDEE